MFWLSNDDIGYVCISFIDYKIKKIFVRFYSTEISIFVVIL